MKTGLLLFAHGARDPAWALPFEQVASQARALAPDAEVRLAFLEFMSPTMPDAGAALARAGCRRVEVVPLFLGAGGHVRKDVPRLLDKLRARHPDVAFRLHPAAGESDEVIAAMARIAVRTAE
ncbi:MAG TPA: CbiX/SirB N-terminal domain-containing protein [Burkholderiaceae bacterium]|nr:CbiX/SirB N-terminal domain-containing protein [Burkholderiaceae bacterium]